MVAVDMAEEIVVEGTNPFPRSILLKQREHVSITGIKVNSSLSFYTQGRGLPFSGYISYLECMNPANL